ncbi:MAG: replication protein P [Acidiferrobacter sp.]
MQHVAALTAPLTTPLSLASSAPQPTSTSQNLLTERHMADLWRRMTRIYGHRWTSAFGATDDSTWLRGLRGLTPAQVGHGLSRCATHREGGWPPTLPEFRALCTPTAEDLGLPTLDAAYREAALADKDHRWSHPAVYAAAQAAGLFELRTLPESKSRPLFERAYEIVTRRVLAGEQFDAPVPRALEKLPVPTRPDVAEAALTAMRALLRR